MKLKLLLPCLWKMSTSKFLHQYTRSNSELGQHAWLRCMQSARYCYVHVKAGLLKSTWDYSDWVERQLSLHALCTTSPSSSRLHKSISDLAANVSNGSCRTVLLRQRSSGITSLTLFLNLSCNMYNPLLITTTVSGPKKRRLRAHSRLSKSIVLREPTSVNSISSRVTTIPA